MRQVIAGTIGGVVTLWAAFAGATPTAAQRCEAKKLEAAGTKAKCLAVERAKAVRGATPNYARCSEAFALAFSRAETKAGPGVCPTEDDATAVEELIDSCADRVATALDGGAVGICQQLPATGQTVAYGADRNDGINGPVAVADDGSLQLGAPLSYTDNGDGTITDNTTGLMW